MAYASAFQTGGAFQVSAFQNVGTVSNELVTFLAANNELSGLDFFENFLPESPVTCMAVIETGGSAPDQIFGSSGIKWENPTVQVLARGVPQDSITPREYIHIAYKLLTTIQAQRLSGTEYLTAVPLQAPFVVTRDAKKRVVWGFNVLFQKELS